MKLLSSLSYFALCSLLTVPTLAAPKPITAKPALSEALKNQRAYIGALDSLNIRFPLANLVSDLGEYERRSQAWREQYLRSGGKVTDPAMLAFAPDAAPMRELHKRIQAELEQATNRTLPIGDIKRVPFSYAGMDESYVAFLSEFKIVSAGAKRDLEGLAASTESRSSAPRSSEPLSEAQLDAIREAHQNFQLLLYQLDKASSALDVQKESLHRDKQVVGLPSPASAPNALSPSSMAAQKAYLAQIRPRAELFRQRAALVEREWQKWVDAKFNHNTTDAEQTANYAAAQRLNAQCKALDAAAKQLGGVHQVPFFYKDVDAGFVRLSVKIHGFSTMTDYLSTFLKDAPVNLDLLNQQTQDLEGALITFIETQKMVKTRELILNSKRVYVEG